MTNKTKLTLQWLFTLLAPLCIMLIPVNDTFTGQMRLYLAITLMAILFFAFGNIHLTVVAFVLPFAYLLTGVTTADVVFRPWTLTTLWMFIGSFFLINALNRCGLMDRISFKTILLFGGSYYGIYAGLCVFGLILALITGGTGTIPMLALAIGICKALNFETFSKEATGIYLTAALAGAVPGYVFYNSTTIMMLAIGSFVGAPATIGWFEHIMLGLPLLAYYVLSILLVIFMFRPKKDVIANVNRSYFVEKYQSLGKITGQEIKALIIVTMMILYMMSTVFTGMDATYGFIFFPLLMYLPGINVGTEADLSNVNLGFILFVAACLGIGMTGGSLGFGNLVSNYLFPMLQDKGAFIFAGAIWLVGFIMNFLLTPMAIYASFSAPIAALAMDLGFDPITSYFLLFMGADQVVFPYECALYLIFFSYGVIKSSDFIKYFSARTLLSLLVLFCITVPYYMIIGRMFL